MFVKNNLKRGIINRDMLISLIASVICLVIGGYESLIIYKQNSYVNAFFSSLTNGTSSIMALVFPIIACIPYAASYAEEKVSGYLNYVIIKVNKKKYIRTKILSCALSGGLAVGVPALVFLIACIWCKGTQLSSTQSEYYYITHAVGLFDRSPIFYCLLYVLNFFLCGAIFALIGLAVSVYINNKYLIHIIPFAIYILLAMLMANININLNPVTLYDINSYSESSLVFNSIYKIVIMIVPMYIFAHGVKIYEE